MNTVTKVLDDAGAANGIASTERDITERKREEATLRRMATVVRDSNDAITIHDFEGRITAWNRGAELMYGYSEAEALLANIDRLTAPDKVEEQKDFIRRLIADEAITSFETRRVTKDGRVLDVWMTVTKLMDDAGNPVGLASTERDITERKRAKEQLKHYTAELETANKALEESKQLAECANRAKSEFLANMSHELRTPLNAVIGFSEGLLERTDRHPLNEHQKDRLGKIKASGDYLLALINDVLDIARIEAGRSQTHLTTFYLGTLAREVRDLAEGLIKERPEIDFRLDLGDQEQLPPITTDRDKLRQILINLVSNAIKFTEQGVVTLRVRRDGEQMVLRVEDTGAGIADEHLEQVFEKFYQVKQNMHRSVKGTGLGLSICHAFADVLGATISVQSAVGRGSTFTVTLPLKPQPQKTQPSTGVSQELAERVRRQCSAQGGDGHRLKVLCIDADASNVLLMNDYLAEKQAGFCVVPAFDGTEGLRLAGSECPQVILLDVALPDSDGWQLLQRLRTGQATAHIPVIVVTALDEKSRGIALGADDYLLKPISKANLLWVVKRVTRPASQALELVKK